jgi:hypothetical protein
MLARYLGGLRHTSACKNWDTPLCMRQSQKKKRFCLCWLEITWQWRSPEPLSDGICYSLWMAAEVCEAQIGNQHPHIRMVIVDCSAAGLGGECDQEVEKSAGP